MLTEILKLKSSWETLKETDLPVIIYGTGDGADKVIDEFERLGIKLSGVMASDSFVRSRTFRGHVVKRLADFEEEYADFIVALGFATQIDEIIQNITDISKRHRVVVPCVPVYDNTVFNRNFIIQNRTALENVYNIFADEISKEVFLDFLRFELTGELKYLFRSETSKDEAFRTILKLGQNENYLDLGAYRGDTIIEFIKYTNNEYKTITALEPDSKTFEKLVNLSKPHENITLMNKGVWSENCYLSFGGERGRGNALKKSGNTTEVVTVDSIQSLAAATYIKADIEGCEGEMLYGAFDTLRTLKPKLNIAAYHRSEDIFALPIKIKEINPDYRIYLRHHHYIPCWDMNLYCI